MLYDLKVTRQGPLRLMKINCYNSTPKYVKKVKKFIEYGI